MEWQMMSAKILAKDKYFMLKSNIAVKKSSSFYFKRLQTLLIIFRL